MPSDVAATSTDEGIGMMSGLLRVMVPTVALALVLTACGGGTSGEAEGGETSSPVETGEGERSPDEGQATEASGEPIKIGYLDSISGTFSFSGTHGEQGAHLAVDEINNSGGILGRPIELVVRDDQSDPAEGTAAMRDLVDEGVLAVAGGIHSGVVAAVSEVARTTEVPFVSKGGYASPITEEDRHRYMIRLVPNTRVIAGSVAASVSEIAGADGLTSVCTVGGDYAYGHDITERFLAALENQYSEAELISGCQFWPALGESEFGSIIQGLQNEGPDIVFFGGVVGSSAPAFVRQAVLSGVVEDVPLWVHTSLGLQENTWSLEESDVVPGIIMGSDFPGAGYSDGTRAFNESYEAEYGDLASSSSAMAYDAIFAIKEAFEAAGEAETEALVDSFQGMEVDYTTGVSATIRPEDNQSTHGWFVGELTWVEEFGTAGMADVEYIPGDEYLLAPDDLP